MKLPLVLKADSGRGQAGERGAAAGEAGDDEISFAESRGPLEDSPCADRAALVGKWVPGLEQLDPRQRGAGIGVAGRR